MQVQFVSLAGRTGQEDWSGEMLASLQRVVAAEVRRLAHLGHRVGIGAAAFAHDQRDQLGDAALQQFRRALQHLGALHCRDLRPGLELARGAGNGGLQPARRWAGSWSERAIGGGPAGGGGGDHAGGGGGGGRGEAAGGGGGGGAGGPVAGGG